LSNEAQHPRLPLSCTSAATEPELSCPACCGSLGRTARLVLRCRPAGSHGQRVDHPAHRLGPAAPPPADRRTAVGPSPAPAGAPRARLRRPEAPFLPDRFHPWPVAQQRRRWSAAAPRDFAPGLQAGRTAPGADPAVVQLGVCRRVTHRASLSATRCPMWAGAGPAGSPSRTRPIWPSTEAFVLCLLGPPFLRLGLARIAGPRTLGQRVLDQVGGFPTATLHAGGNACQPVSRARPYLLF